MSHTLELTTEEALWLRAVVQNPLSQEPDEEDPEQAQKRHHLFTALTEALFGENPLHTTNQDNDIL